MKKQKIDITEISNLEKECLKLVKSFNSRQVVLLNGPMAAGKTKSVEFFVKALGGKYVSSPTFAIHQTYATPVGEIDHIDLYRLKSDYDLETTGFWELFHKQKGVIFIEWADRLEGDWIPKGWGIIKLSFKIEDHSRFLLIER